VAAQRIIVAGARGVFGALLASELRARGYEVVATTRDTLDLGNLDAVAAIARGAFAFACAAGPFQQLDRALVHVVVESGAHWLDIADDAQWFFDLLDDRALDALARSRGVGVMPGLSSLPAISGALLPRVLPADRVTITLFIGNDNPKGAAAIASGAALHSPDRELLRRERGIDARVRVRFEMPGARLAMQVLRVVPLRARLRLAKMLSPLLPRFGSRSGYVEVTGSRTERIEVDQRGAILPLVFALKHIGEHPGCHPPTVLDGEGLLNALAPAPAHSR